MATACYFCHAPLSMQNEMLYTKGSSANGGYIKNPAFDETLKSTGVTCGVCHARGGRITGPASPKLRGLKKGVRANHGVIEKNFFEKAEFCAACHQLKDGFRLNGKPLVNTYEEWKKSAFGKAGIPCQTCHMPGRRHLFRGIHDPAMAISGLKVDVKGINGADGAAARLTITNTGAGHDYPTYATPLIVVKGYLVLADGRILQDTLREAYIGRKISLDLSEEFFDTRIAPLESMVLEYPLGNKSGAKSLVFTATVYPDEFYNRFYEYYLSGSSSTGKTKSRLEAAHKRSSNSAYELFRKEIPLADLRPDHKNKR